MVATPQPLVTTTPVLNRTQYGILDVYANSRQVMRIVHGGAQIFGSTGDVYSTPARPDLFSTLHLVASNDGASAIVRQEHQDRYFILGGLGNRQFGIYIMINKSRSENGTDGGFSGRKWELAM